MCTTRIRQVELECCQRKAEANVELAEFRGPGARNSFDHEDPEDYDLDIRRDRPGFGGKNGKIILLGDGTEVLTDSTDDAEMFDHSMEDSDEEQSKNEDSSATSDNDSKRGEREGTPGPRTTEQEHEKHESASKGPGSEIKGVAAEPGSK